MESLEERSATRNKKRERPRLLTARMGDRTCLPKVKIERDYRQNIHRADINLTIRTRCTCSGQAQRRKQTMYLKKMRTPQNPPRGPRRRTSLFAAVPQKEKKQQPPSREPSHPEKKVGRGKISPSSKALRNPRGGGWARLQCSLSKEKKLRKVSPLGPSNEENLSKTSGKKEGNRDADRTGTGRKLVPRRSTFPPGRLDASLTQKREISIKRKDELEKGGKKKMNG